jgi:hypothetical protein
MARLDVAVRWCCLWSAYAATAGALGFTATSVKNVPSAGVGFRVDISGCTAPAADSDVGCKVNSTAIFKVQDDSANSIVNTFCTAFDAFVEEPTASSTTTVAGKFFYAFTMPAGHTGSYWMSPGCFLDDLGDVLAVAGKGYPDSTGSWQALKYTNPGSQFTNQPQAAATVQVLTENQTDIYIPYLLLATPHSIDEAFSDTYRAAQFHYGSTGSSVVFYFSEPILPVAGKSLTLNAFTPGQAWSTTATTPAETITKAASTDATTSMLGTKAEFASLGLKGNRLYKVLLDAGSFADVEGNAVGAVNGLGSTYSTCESISGSPIAKNCLIVFAVPLTSAVTTKFPVAVTGSPVVDLAVSTTISQETNVIFEFSDAVEHGKYADVTNGLKLTFGSDLTSADLTIGGSSGANCDKSEYCHRLFSGTYYIFEPKADLKDATSTSNATEVTVTVPKGAFDYVDAFSYTFLTNSTPAGGRDPELRVYEFATSSKAYLAASGPYYSVATD